MTQDTKNIKIFDTTMRDGEQSPGASMNIEEKIKIAHALETLGVDIIAGNNDDNLQPMVLGDNLVDALFSMAAVVSALVGSHQSVLNDLVSLNAALSAHTHPSAFFGLPTLPGPMLQMYSIQSLIKLVSVDSFSAFAHKFNLNNYTFKYLWPGAPKTVRSYYNNVN